MARPPAGKPPVAHSPVVADTEEKKRKDVQNYLTITEALSREDRMADLRSMLGSDDAVARFVAVALNAIATDSDLLTNATPVSIIQAVKDSATLGLEPTGLTGEAVIIRYERTARLSPMWRGILKRVRNSGKVRDIDVHVVYANDDFDYGYNERGGWFNHHPSKPTPPTAQTTRALTVVDPNAAKASNGNGTAASEPPATVDRGDYWGAYAYAVMPSGFVELEVMPAIEINHTRDTYSQSVKAGRKSPWDTEWGEMARKTVLNRLNKRLPQDAVDNALIAIEAINEQMARETAEQGRLDVSVPRHAALAAIMRGRKPDDSDVPGSPELTDGTDQKQAADQKQEPAGQQQQQPDDGPPNDGSTTARKVDDSDVSSGEEGGPPKG